MAVDKKITELPAFTGNVALADIFLIVSGGTDYQLTGQQLIDFVQAAAANGSVVSFTNVTPANSAGKNGDVVIKPGSGEFWQKVSGVWAIQYTVPAPTAGNTILYGSGAPNVGTGSLNDTYINTDAGVFYKKNNTPAWVSVFSMATGPAGAPGANGTNGAAGANGKTVLNGTTPPSNIDDGVNGDFYINKNSWLIYGPKAAGVWPAGVSLIGNSPNFKQAYNYDVLDTRFSYNSTTLTLVFTLNSTDQLLFPYGTNSILNALLREKFSATKYKQKNSFEPIIEDDGTKYKTVTFEGVDSDTITRAQILLS